MSTTPIGNAANYWSTSNLSSDWNTFEVSFDERSIIFLSGDDYKVRYPDILSFRAFKPHWKSNSLVTIYLFVQHSDHEFGSYQLDLATNTCSDEGASLMLRRQQRSRLKSLPRDWQFIGPTVSGRLISGPGCLRTAAFCAFSAQKPTLLAHHTFFPGGCGCVFCRGNSGIMERGDRLQLSELRRRCIL